MATSAHSVTLRDGTTVELRRLEAGDVEAVAAFFRAMPERDLLFFRQDISSVAVIRGWVFDAAVPGGERRTLATIAVGGPDRRIVGLAAVTRRAPAWSRHVGDVIVIVDRDLRGRSLGKLLLRAALLDAAASLGLEKIVARVIVEDREIVQIFERLGFRHEGTLLDHARGRDGTLYDLALLALDLRRYGAALERAESTEIDLSRFGATGQ